MRQPAARSALCPFEITVHSGPHAAREALTLLLDGLTCLALEAEEVRFDGPTETIEGMVSTATFYDPDGNALMLAQDLTKAA